MEIVASLNLTSSSILSIFPLQKNAMMKIFKLVIIFQLFFQAHVICKQLGYSGALRTTKDSTFGVWPKRESFSSFGFKCNGNETALDDCQPIEDQECSTGQPAGVVCNDGGIHIFILNNFIENVINMFNQMGEHLGMVVSIHDCGSEVCCSNPATFMLLLTSQR